MAYQAPPVNANMTPGQIAALYDDFVRNSGGKDTQQTRQEASQYLLANGLNQRQLDSSYDAYLNTYGQPKQQLPQMQTPVMRGYDQKNPYLGQMANTITGQVNENLMRNVMPQINGAAMGAGQFGSSRQGVVQANALRDANQQLSNSLTGMYYGDYNNAMNRNLQQYMADQNYNLGLGRLNEGARQFDEGFGLQKDQFGFNSALSLQNAFNNNANLGLNAATNIYNQPLNYWNQFANAANSFAGQGGVSNQNMYRDPLMGAAALATAGNQLYRQWGNGGYNTNDGYGYSYQQGGTGGAPTATGSANFLAPY